MADGDFLERLIAQIEHPLTKDLARYFSTAGWDVEVEGTGERHKVIAYATLRGVSGRVGSGPRLTGLDLLEMTAFLRELQISRESAPR